MRKLRDKETGRLGADASPAGLFALSVVVVAVVVCLFTGIATAADGDALAERRAIAELVKRGAVVKRFDQKATGIEGLLVRIGDDYGVDRRIVRKDGTVEPDVVDLLEALDDLTLEIRGTTLSDEGLKALSALTHLHGLDVSGSKIGDDGIEYINAFDQLVLLDLSLTNVSDSGLAKLRSTKSLGTLSLQGTRVTAKSLPHLSTFAGLKSLFLPAGFSQTALDSFAESLPECRVAVAAN